MKKVISVSAKHDQNTGRDITISKDKRGFGLSVSKVGGYPSSGIKVYLDHEQLLELINELNKAVFYA